MSWYLTSKDNVAITAERARERVEANREAVEQKRHRQRPISHVNKLRLKAAMVGGRFINNRDPIIFNEAGYILEGQHRLEACAETGVTIYLDVRVSPSVVDGVRVIETYGGKPREMGLRLWLSDGSENNKRLAAVCNMLSFVGTRRTTALEIGQVRSISDLFSKEMETIIPIAYSGQKEKRTWFVAPLIWAAKINRDAAIEFVTRYVTMENVPKGDPALALRQWVGNRKISNGYGCRENQMDAVCSALRSHFAGEKVSRIQAVKPSHDWLLVQSKSLSRKVWEIAFPPELNPVPATIKTMPLKLAA
jgi:hypothetical protein